MIQMELGKKFYRSLLRVDEIKSSQLLNIFIATGHIFNKMLFPTHSIVWYH